MGEAKGSRVVDAVGPESFAFRELVAAISKAIGRPRPIISIPPSLGLLVARLVGFFQHDVFLTREEIGGLMEGLLESSAPTTGAVRLTEWAAEHRTSLGYHYASEMQRRRQRETSYAAAS
jgi:NADH dehydrogenase